MNDGRGVVGRAFGAAILLLNLLDLLEPLLKPLLGRALDYVEVTVVVVGKGANPPVTDAGP